MLQHGSSWCEDLKNYHSGEEGPQGLVTLSPTWFKQGHDVSTSANRIYFSAAHSESGNSATIPVGFCKL